MFKKKDISNEHSYEELKSRIQEKQLPKHIAIIMDGNGRWAKKRFLPRIAGHRAGVETVRMTVKTARDLNIKHVTLYAFSTENWTRPKDEVNSLMKYLEEFLKKEVDELHENNVKLTAMGRIHDLPDFAQRELKKASERTADNTGLNLNLALNYSGRAEIIDAVKKIITNSADLNAETFTAEDLQNYLYCPELPDPDLLIRTSGEIRISNFFLWQLAYTELWITEKFWPDFTREDFAKAVHDYQNRERRFGGLVQNG